MSEIKKCDLCGGLGAVNSPLEKYTNAQGCTECWRHKDIRDCIWKFRFILEGVGHGILNAINADKNDQR